MRARLNLLARRKPSQGPSAIREGPYSCALGTIGMAFRVRILFGNIKAMCAMFLIAERCTITGCDVFACVSVRMYVFSTQIRRNWCFCNAYFTSVYILLLLLWRKLAKMCVELGTSSMRVLR